MHVSVIVPHYNDLEGLDICLAALARQTFPAERVEILVADNASPQGQAAVEKIVAGRARVVTVTTRGAGPARNGGAAASRGDILAFIDSDCQADQVWLAEGIKALERCDIAGGSVEVLVKDAARMTAAEAFERIFAFNMERYVTEKGFVGSGNLFCRRWRHGTLHCALRQRRLGQDSRVGRARSQLPNIRREALPRSL